MASKPVRIPLRLCIALSLVWIVPATTAILILALDDAGVKSPIHDDVFLLVFIGTSQVVAASFFLWHRLIEWTFRRIAGVGGTTAVLLTHLLLWQPLWDAGCMESELLFGQSCAMGGIWVFATAYVWWGLARAAVWWRKRTMPPYAVRLIYGLGLVPFIPGLWVVLVLALEQTGLKSFQKFGLSGDQVALSIVHFVCGLFIVLWWWLVWRRKVRWSSPLVWRSLMLAGGYLLLIVLAPLPDFDASWLESLSITGPLMLTGLWFVVTTWMWQPHTADALMVDGSVRERLVCLTCGYSLVGLREARCPECGEQATLDELFENVLLAQAVD